MTKTDRKYVKTVGGSGSRPHIALLIETSLAPGRDILRGIARYVREHRPWGLYHEAHGLDDRPPNWLSRWRGDGVIARIQSPHMAQAIAASGLPAVDVLGTVGGLPYPLVHVDNRAIARMAARHLLERGLRHFGFFGIKGENWSEERYEAFCAAVAPGQGLSQVPSYQLPRDALTRRSWEQVENRLARWVATLPKPVGVFVCSDQRGPQFLEACRRAQVAVPEDVAVVSVDNDEPLCEVCSPPLSSVEASHITVGYEAAALLDKLLHGAPAPKKPLLITPERVITRLSTQMLAVGDPAIASALQMIREHAHAGLHVDAIARHAGLSRSVLQRRFRRELKRSVHQEILAVRIQRARELLIKSNLPLAIVAERAGFRHQEYMGAVFKAHLGTTPAKVRHVGV
jgi:LacI family transcriptional regulator